VFRLPALLRFAVFLLLPALLLVPLVPLVPTADAADDPCPESNDTFQAACYLGTGGDAIGFISRPDDVDAYRFELRDFGTGVHLKLVDRPHPYRLSLVNYNGDVLESDPDGEIVARLELPGTYYVFVDSGTGQFDDGVPYVLNETATYATPPGPQVVYSHEFSRSSPDAFQDTGSRQFSNANGTYTLDPITNRFTFQLNAAASLDKPTSEQFVLLPDPPEPGPVVDTFTMAIDTRMVEPVDAGYTVLFRYVDSGNFYQVSVRLGTRQISVGKVINGELNELTGLRSVPKLSQTGVNRTVIRAAGTDIRVNVNGENVAQLQDASLERGLVGFGAVTWAGPITTNFDNILVTVP